MKRILSVLLSLLLLVGLLAACSEESTPVAPSDPGSTASPSGNAGDNDGKGEIKAVDWSKHQEFSVWLFSDANDYYSSYSDNPVVQYLNKKFNVTLTYEQPAAGTESDSLSLMFGTGQYTDMINVSMYTGSISELYEDGVIIDIAEYLDYMPNFKALLDKNDELRKYVTNDEGRILKLPVTAVEPETIWGSLVYRHDILDIMTGGYVAFPSGNDVPTTIEDWDYMLPLFKAYFDAAGMTHGAPLILPSNGYFYYGELGTGFGFHGGDYYVDGDGKVNHAFLSDGLYDYLKKLNEWYEAGYIYKDFASRVNDPFYLPNPELTYGGAAGIWFGLTSQLGDAMSMPDYGLYMDVRALPSPLADGVQPSDLLKRNPPPHEGSGVASVVTTTCPDIPKLLSVIDYMYSEEGGMMWGYGLNKEQLADSNGLYEANNLEEGAYWFEGDKFVFNPALASAGGTVDLGSMSGMRLPGLSYNIYTRDVLTEESRKADAIWAQYDSVATNSKLPASLSYSTDDEKYMADVMVNINDFIGSKIPNFIMGTEPLTEESFNAFRNQLIAYGLEDCIRIRQDAYDRYLKR